MDGCSRPFNEHTTGKGSPGASCIVQIHSPAQLKIHHCFPLSQYSPKTIHNEFMISQSRASPLDGAIGHAV